MPDRYAVIGHPIAHSQSPCIHNLFARRTGQDMSYEAILAPLDGFAAAVRAFISAGGRGANVTLPFKEEACRLAQRLSVRAQAAGAANTLVFDEDGILADNTDGVGLVRDICHNLGARIAGQRVLLLGAGGAARGAILPLLLEQPALFLIANRTAQKARRLADEFNSATTRALTELAAGNAAVQLQGCGLSELAGRRFDIVINATSAGLSGQLPEIPGGVFASGCLAYEMVYGRHTPFMTHAYSEGALVSDGLGMLVEQAAEAFQLWRGVRPETTSVLKELRAT